MGYIHDAQMKLWLPPELISASDGLASWAMDFDGSVWALQRPAAGAGAWQARLALAPPCNNLPDRGARPLSLEVWYSASGATLSDCAAHIEKYSLPAHGAAWSAAVAVGFAYDGNHDSAGERCALGSHRMALSITTPEWISAEQFWQLRLSGTAALASVVRVYGAVLSYTLRL
jgi:hypothetical protein